MSSGPEKMEWGDVVVRLVKVIGEKTPARGIEFGFDDDNPRKWWAKCVLRSGRVRFAEVTLADDVDLRMGPVNALAELGRELGLSIRIRDPVVEP